MKPVLNKVDIQMYIVQELALLHNNCLYDQMANDVLHEWARFQDNNQYIIKDIDDLMN